MRPCALRGLRVQALAGPPAPVSRLLFPRCLLPCKCYSWTDHVSFEEPRGLTKLICPHFAPLGCYFFFFVNFFKTDLECIHAPNAEPLILWNNSARENALAVLDGCFIKGAPSDLGGCSLPGTLEEALEVERGRGRQRLCRGRARTP